MPIVDANDPAVWSTQWRTYVDGQQVGYCRAGFYEGKRVTADLLTRALELRAGQRVALIGAGFAWTAEWLEQAGVEVVATDTSTWIHANKHTEAKHEILDLDVMRDADRARLGEKFNWVVSENVLPWLRLDEAVAFDAAMRKLGPVAHYVTPLIPNLPPEPEPKWSWLSLEDWKRLLPEARIVGTTGEVV